MWSERQGKTRDSRIKVNEKCGPLQLLCWNSVRISGVPESRINNTEDTADVVVQLMAKAGANIAASDIEQAYRIGKRNSQTPQTPPNPLTPVVKRPIIVKFANRSTKKLSVKSKTKLPKGIYINDDLTKARSTVAFRARTLVKSKAAKTTWTDDGKVFIIDNADKKHIVTTEKALDDLKKTLPPYVPSASFATVAATPPQKWTQDSSNIMVILVHSIALWHSQFHCAYILITYFISCLYPHCDTLHSYLV